jgi:hypothetical protein
MGDPSVDALRSFAVEQVRGMDRVPTGTQLLREGEHPVGESLHVVEDHDFSHLYTPDIGRRIK